MKWFTSVGIVCVALATAVSAAESTFTAALSPAELEAAGLANLTPAQRAQLDTLVEKFRGGSLAEARRAAEAAVREKQLAEAKAAQAEVNAAAARADAAKAQEMAKAQEAVAARAEAQNLVARAERSRKAGPKAEPVTIESTIVGKFQGWHPRSIFVLANGQRWQVANNESYYAPAAENPRVQIRPAALTGYWMHFPDLGAEVRVKLLNEE